MLPLLPALLLNIVEVLAEAPDLRLHKGRSIHINERPFHVVLYLADPPIPLCGGSIIHKRAVLTAANCFPRRRPAEIFIRMGLHNLTQKYEPFWYSVQAHIPHERYGRRDKASWSYDIALIIPTKEFEFGRNIQLVRLSRDTPDILSEVVVSGFEHSPANQGRLQKLSVKTLVIQERKTCQDMLPKGFYQVDDKMICVVDPDGNEDACSWDSGSPLTHNGVLVGIESWGPQCVADEPKPIFFTDVAQFADWIDAKLGPYNCAC